MILVFNGIFILIALFVSSLIYFLGVRRIDRECGIGSRSAAGAPVMPSHSSPIGTIKTNPDYALYLFQIIAQYDLSLDREAMARKIALREAAAGTPSVESLVQAWRVEPELADFADAVGAAMIELR